MLKTGWSWGCDVVYEGLKGKSELQVLERILCVEIR